MRTARSVAALSAIVIVALFVLMSGCERSKYPTESQSIQTEPGGGLRSSTQPANLPQSVVLQGFTVTYNGRTVANNQTTFTYNTSGQPLTATDALNQTTQIGFSSLAVRDRRR